MKPIAAGMVLVALAGCSTQPHSVQILVGTGCTTPQTIQADYVRVLEEQVFPQLHNARVLLAPVTGRSFTAKVYPLEFPDLSQENPLLAKQKQRQQIEQAKAALQTLNQEASGDCRPGSEIVGAILAAAPRFQGKPGVLLMLVHGFEQSQYMNLYDYRQNLHQGQVRQTLIERLRTAGAIANLAGIEVCMTGLTAGSDQNANTWLTSGIRAFWQDYFSASKAKSLHYTQGVQGCPL